MSALKAPLIQREWKGLLDYTDWLPLQKEACQTSLNKKKNFLFGMEHKKSITLGIRSSKKKEDNFVLSETEIKKKEVEIFKVLRGGRAALHAPGQLMIYPVLNLNPLNFKPKEYIQCLLETSIHFLENHNVKVFTKKNEPGLFTKKGKMVFLGLRFHQGITSHGIAINVSNDLSLFSMIKNCGKSKASFDSLREYSVLKRNQDLFEEWFDLFLIYLEKKTKSTCLS